MQGGNNHSAVSSNSHFLMNCHKYCMPIIELMKNLPQYFFFFCCKRQAGSKPKYVMVIFSYAQNSQYNTRDKASHLGCLLEEHPRLQTQSLFCGSLNISLFILSGTASGGEMENAFYARMTNGQVIHSGLC